MTNSPEPPQQRDRRNPLDFDEWVALLVAFGTIGAILFWSMMRPQGGTWNWAKGFGANNNQTGLVGNDGAAQIAAGGKGLMADLGLGGEEVERTTGPIAQPTVKGEADVNAIDNTFIGPQAIPGRRPSGAGLAAAGVAGAAAGIGATAGAPAAETPVTETPAPLSSEAASPTAIVTETPAAVVAPSTETPASPTTTATASPTESPIVEATDAPELGLPDIPQSSWVYPFAASLKKGDRLGELPNAQKFDVDAPVTRAEFATLISQGEQVQGDAAAAAKEFADIGDTFWAASSIAGAQEAGFMKGYTVQGGGKVFRHEQQIPRWQVFVAIASGLQLQPPTDVDAVLSKFDTEGIPQWARAQVAATVSEGLVINPKDQTQLEATRPTTRGEAAAMIQQVLERQNKVDKVESKVTVQP